MQTAEGLVSELALKLGHAPTCCVVTFGCQMNARDSEKILGVLKAVGYQETDSEDEADLVVYNTCTVRDNANQRVYGRLGHLHAMKKKNPAKRIALCGCMIQEPDVIEKIRSSYRFVDLLFGTHNLYKFPELLKKMLESDHMIIDVWKQADTIVEDLPVVRKYPFKSGVNIMFGCDNYCTYCIVPYVRGRERSRASKEILREVERLAAEGVSEVMLLGQNVNSYGSGLNGELSFPQLLQEVEKVEGIRRIRFMTSHPKDLSEELIAVMRDSKKICRHLHLPVQSGSTEVLRKMNRHYTREQYLALVARLRREIPDLSLTTDIIVGFPSETREDLEETIRLVEEVGYDNAFTFIYSPRTGTPAASWPMQMSEEEISEGFERLLKVVQEKARESVAKLTGRTEEALVEEVNSHDASLVTGRLSNNVLVHFPGDASMIGQYHQVKLKENRGFYFIGEKV
ncbi:MAG: tRNA (N6-isopentenyl adenosine(37)-C2)-methylthiotransferase MiaB [Lachnospiraceae bacterium]|nr:tRNA (N6-isopentenyl adenosine(37)-C2)-methylthiotransferase MiaB [Lachnospiraceae bacterium]